MPHTVVVDENYPVIFIEKIPTVKPHEAVEFLIGLKFNSVYDDTIQNEREKAENQKVGIGFFINGVYERVCTGNILARDVVAMNGIILFNGHGNDNEIK